MPSLFQRIRPRIPSSATKKTVPFISINLSGLEDPSPAYISFISFEPSIVPLLFHISRWVVSLVNAKKTLSPDFVSDEGPLQPGLRSNFTGILLPSSKTQKSHSAIKYKREFTGVR